MLSLIPLVAAAALAGGGIPVWDSIQRFPDSSYWSGNGRQRTSNMLGAIRTDVGSELRSAGPGPQQLAARWMSGRLTANEKVAVLLAGADFHDASLLPVYQAALKSSDFREKQAAMIGLHWLLGEASPDATEIAEDSRAWSFVSRLADELVDAVHERTLVEIWADSYLAAARVPGSDVFVLRRSPDDCLRAIREIATPADLNTLVALWPLIAVQQDRYNLMVTIEMVTLQKFVEIAKSPRGGWGSSFYEASAKRVDEWVGGLCGAVDGEQLVRLKASSLGRERGLSPRGAWLLLSRVDYPPVWSTVAEALVGFGAPAVAMNRQQPDDPRNKENMRRVRERFPASVIAVDEAERQEQSRPLR